mgnify:FL=1
MAEMLDTNRQNYIEEKRRHNEKVQKSQYYKIVGVAAAIAAVVVDAVVKTVFNPWEGIWSSGNVFGDVVTILPLLVMLTSMLYIYQVYQKVLQFCGAGGRCSVV